MSDIAEDELRETFDHFDTDDNGTIDFAEFTSLMDALGSEMTDEEMEIGFEEIDEDQDGYIEFEEFLTWWSGL